MRRDRVDDFLLEAAFQRKLGVHHPLVLAAPAPRGDEDGELLQLRRQLALPAQLFAEPLHLARELGVVDERDERPAHLAARAGADLGGDFALCGRHGLFA